MSFTPDGFENPNGDQSRVQPTQMTDEERQLQQKIRRSESIFEQASGTLERDRSKCKHRVFKDIRGFPYDLRTCIICGLDLGVV